MIYLPVEPGGMFPQYAIRLINEASYVQIRHGIGFSNRRHHIVEHRRSQVCRLYPLQARTWLDTCPYLQRL